METTPRNTPECDVDHDIKQEPPDDGCPQSSYSSIQEQKSPCKDDCISAHIKSEIKSEQTCFADPASGLERDLGKSLTSNIDHDKAPGSVMLETATPGCSNWSPVNVKRELEDAIPLIPEDAVCWDLETDHLDNCKVDLEEYSPSKLEQLQDHEISSYTPCGDTTAIALNYKPEATPRTTYQHKSSPPSRVRRIYRCARCPTQCLHRSSLIRHLQVKHDPNAEVYQCSQCVYKSKSKLDFLRHWKVQHDPNAEVYKCDECEYETKARKNLSRHVHVRHDVTAVDYKCTQCSYTTKVKGSLKFHIERLHEAAVEIYTCEECNCTFKTRRSYKKHTKVKHNPDSEDYRCVECEYSSKSMEQFIRHWEKRHDPNAKIYNCTQCAFTSKDKQCFAKHVQINHDANAEAYKCAECDYTSKVRRNFDRHVLIKHDANAKIFKCGQWDYASKEKRYFEKPLRLYQDAHAEVYKCGQCHYTSKYKGNLLAHIKQNHNANAKVYRCPLCSYTCRLKGKLIKHVLQTHAYEYIECGYTCPDNEELKIPKQHHDSADEVYKCFLCEYTSKVRLDFFKHLRTSHCNPNYKTQPTKLLANTTEAEEYNCVECHCTFGNEHQLKEHSVQYHKSNDKLECDYTSNIRINLFKHLKMTHYAVDAMRYDCVECEFSSNDKQRYKLHLKTHNDDQPKLFWCTQCHRTFQDEDDYKRHVSVEHTDYEENKCTEHTYISKLERHLKEHVKLTEDTSSKAYESSACRQAVKNKDLLKYDRNPKHTKEYKCMECEYTSKSRSLFKRHWSITHDNDAEVHDYTSKDGDKQVKLRQGVSLKFSIHSYKCVKCDYTGKVWSDFSDHVKGHDTADYKCAECSYTTKVREELCRHVAVEHGKRKSDLPDTCNSENNREANAETSNSKPEKVALVARPKLYKCARCEYTSEAVSLLKQHMNTKHGLSAKEYKCMECNFTSKCKELFVNHWNIAHEL